MLGACGGRGGEGGGQSVRSAKPRDWSGTVTRVTDGDTLSIAPASGAPRKVRIDGIDAPESCQTGGAAAGAALRRKVMGQRVQVATRALDMYQRELATVRIDGQDVGAWLVEQGHAWSYRYREDNGPYLREEQRARRATRGVFADRRA
ncbi:MAG: thermonuclease family protein, partial [Burkholderiaceae bacterium]